jgi:hypothetical protein
MRVRFGAKLIPIRSSSRKSPQTVRFGASGVDSLQRAQFGAAVAIRSKGFDSEMVGGLQQIAINSKQRLAIRSSARWQFEAIGAVRGVDSHQRGCGNNLFDWKFDQIICE